MEQDSEKELRPADDHNYTHLPLGRISIFTNTFIFFFQPFSLFPCFYLIFLHVVYTVESRSAHLMYQTDELTGNSNQDRQHTKSQKAPDGRKIPCILPLFFFLSATVGFICVQLHLFQYLFSFLIRSFLFLYHRIMRLEGISVDRLVNPPDSKQKQEEQIAQGHVWLGFEHLQGRRLYNLSGQPFPVFDHSPCKKVCGGLIFKNGIFCISICACDRQNIGQSRNGYILNARIRILFVN